MNKSELRDLERYYKIEFRQDWQSKFNDHIREEKLKRPSFRETMWERFEAYNHARAKNILRRHGFIEQADSIFEKK